MIATQHDVPARVERWLLPAAALLFFLSGASALAYEVAWVKVLTLQFGSSAWSISTVVASFMAGLGAGSAWAGRQASGLRRPLKTLQSGEEVLEACYCSISSR